MKAMQHLMQRKASLMLLICFVIMNIPNDINAQTSTNKSPYFNAIKYITELTQDISSCQVKVFNIPEDFFLDDEDTNTKNMNLSLLAQLNPDVPIQQEFWIGLDTTRQVLVAVPQDQAYHERPNDGTYTFYLIATDTGGKRASAQFRYNLIGLPPYDIYNITFDFFLSNIANLPYAAQTEYLLSNVTSALKTTVKFYVRRFSLLAQEGKDAIGRLVLSPCFLGNSCNLSSVEHLHSKVFDKNNKGTFTAPFRSPLSTNIKVRSITEQIDTRCKQEPPIIVQRLPLLNVSYCTPLSYSLQQDTFYDYIDGYTSKLRVSLLNFDLTEVKYNSFVYFDNITFTLFSVINDRTFKKDEKRPIIRKFILQAKNSRDKSVNLEIRILVNESAPISPYFMRAGFRWSYKPPLSLTKMLISMYARATLYFKAPIHFIHVEEIPKTDYFITVTSICLYNSSDCNSAGLRNLTMTDLGVNVAFQYAMLPDFTILTANIYHSDSCKITNFKPIGKSILDPIYASPCSTFQKVINKEDFQDEEDNMNLTISIYKINGKVLTNPSGSWISVASKERVIYGVILHEVALSQPAGGYNITLRATDTGGLFTESTVMLYVDRSVPPNYYTVKMAFSNVAGQGATTLLGDLFTIANTLNNKYFSQNITNVISFKRGSMTESELVWGICTLSKCNETEASLIRSKIIVNSTKLRNQLVDIFKPQFVLKTASIAAKNVCIGILNPPKPLLDVWTINVSYCGGAVVSVPATAFYDSEDGGTRNLSLMLLGKNGKQSSRSDWIQFDSKTQKIHAFPTRQESLSYMTSGTFFYIQATDRTGLAARMKLNISFSFPLQVPQYKTAIRYFSRFKHQSKVTELFYFSSLLAKFLGDTDSKGIGLQSFIQQEGVYHQFTYSNCNISYSPCNIKALDAIRDSLFINGRATPNFARVMEGAFDIHFVYSEATGACKETHGGVISVKTNITVLMPRCGYRALKVQESWFYDLHKSGRAPFHYALLYLDGYPVDLEDWIQVDSVSNELKLILSDEQMKLPVMTFNFVLQANGSNGKTERIGLVIRKLDTMYVTPIATITFELYFPLASNETFVSQKIFLMQRLSLILRIPVNQLKLIVFEESPSSPNYRVATWALCSHQTCFKSLYAGMDLLLTSFYNSFGRISAEIQKYLSPKAELKRLYANIMCNNTGEPPSVLIPMTTQRIKFCSFHKFKVLPNTFRDKLHVNSRYLDLKLLDGNGHKLSSSSWLQFNSATLEMSGYALESEVQVRSSYTFRLQATNVFGLSTYSQFFVILQNEPYITNCPVSLSVRRNSNTVDTTDLNVLTTLVNQISRYYGDKVTRIKFLSFRRTGRYEYIFVYTNCSFEQNTYDRAKSGLAESYRKILTSIFSEIVNESNEIKTKFLQFMKSHFQILSASVSYNCIRTFSSRTTSEVQNTAYMCQEYQDIISPTLFQSQLGNEAAIAKFTLHYQDGSLISDYEWIQLEEKTKTIKGVVTNYVKEFGSAGGYNYLLRATTQAKFSEISYKVEVPEPLPSYDLRFIVGFRMKSTTAGQKHLDIADIIRRISKYLYPDNEGIKTNIYPQYYSDNTILSFSYCSLLCKPEQIKGTLSKLQQTMYHATPNQKFIQALQPNYELYYVFMDRYRCIEYVNIRIVVQKISWQNINHCGWSNFKIASSTFKDNSNHFTEDFSLQLLNNTNMPVSMYSWIKLDTTIQTVTVIPIGAIISTTMTFAIAAKHPLTGSKNSAPMEMKFTSPDGFNFKQPTVCTLTTTFKTTYGYYYSDVFVLQELITKLSTYFKGSYRQIYVYDYHREISRQEVSLTWTNCSWTYYSSSYQQSQNYRREMQTFTSLLYYYNSSSILSIRHEFHTHLKPEFNVMSMKNVSYCEKPPGSLTPKISTLNITSKCGELYYKLPKDLFLKDGAIIENLTLALEQKDGSALPKDTWLYLNHTSGALHGLPAKGERNSAPVQLYEYLLKATSPSGETAGINVTIEVLIGALKPVYYVSVLGQFKAAYKYNIEVILYVSRLLSASSYGRDQQNRLFLQDEPIISPSNFLLKFANCSVCDLTANLVLQNIASSTSVIKAAALPVAEIFTVVGIEESAFVLEQVCDDETNIQEASKSPLQVKFCTNWMHDMILLLQTPLHTSSLLKVESGERKPFQQNSWLWFNQSSRYLHAFPTLKDLQTQPATGELISFYVVSAELGRKLGLRGYKYVIINDTAPSPSLEIQLNMITMESSQHINAYFITKILQKLSLYLKRSDFQSIAFQRLSATPFRISYHFQLCGLPNMCYDHKVQELRSLIFEGKNTVRQELRDLFRPFFQIENLAIHCNQSTDISIREDYKVSMISCLNYTLMIPANLTHDNWGVEYNLTLHDYIKKNQSTQWVKIDRSTRTLKVERRSSYNVFKHRVWLISSINGSPVINTTWIIYFKNMSSLDCANGTIPLIRPSTEFPWWTLIVVLAILGFFLLIWLCWVCIPRCCPGLCVGLCSCCPSCCYRCCIACCAPGGKCSSLEKGDESKEESEINFEKTEIIDSPTLDEISVTSTEYQKKDYDASRLISEPNVIKDDDNKLYESEIDEVDQKVYEEYSKKSSNASEADSEREIEIKIGSDGTEVDDYHEITSQNSSHHSQDELRTLPMLTLPMPTNKSKEVEEEHLSISDISVTELKPVIPEINSVAPKFAQGETTGLPVPPGLPVPVGSPLTIRSRSNFKNLPDPILTERAARSSVISDIVETQLYADGKRRQSVILSYAPNGEVYNQSKGTTDSMSLPMETRTSNSKTNELQSHRRRSSLHNQEYDSDLERRQRGRRRQSVPLISSTRQPENDEFYAEERTRRASTVRKSSRRQSAVAEMPSKRSVGRRQSSSQHRRESRIRNLGYDSDNTQDYSPVFQRRQSSGHINSAGELNLEPIDYGHIDNNLPIRLTFRDGETRRQSKRRQSTQSKSYVDTSPESKVDFVRRKSEVQVNGGPANEPKFLNDHIDSDERTRKWAQNLSALKRLDAKSIRKLPAPKEESRTPKQSGQHPLADVDSEESIEIIVRDKTPAEHITNREMSPYKRERSHSQVSLKLKRNERSQSKRERRKSRQERRERRFSRGHRTENDSDIANEEGGIRRRSVIETRFTNAAYESDSYA